jgi:hypothetical protein
MPEYLAPGVFVEEVSYRSKSIEGVSTTTTGFVGPTRYGPVEIEPEVITNVAEFERIYGDGKQLNFSDDGTLHNYMWHGVRAFFEEGGKRMYVARTFRPVVCLSENGYVAPPTLLKDDHALPSNGRYETDGHARCWLTPQTAAMSKALRAVDDLGNAIRQANGLMAAVIKEKNAALPLQFDSNLVPIVPPNDVADKADEKVAAAANLLQLALDNPSGPGSDVTKLLQTAVTAIGVFEFAYNDQTMNADSVGNKKLDALVKVRNAAAASIDILDAGIQASALKETAISSDKAASAAFDILTGVAAVLGVKAVADLVVADEGGVSSTTDMAKLAVAISKSCEKSGAVEGDTYSALSKAKVAAKTALTDAGKAVTEPIDANLQAAIGSAKDLVPLSVAAASACNALVELVLRLQNQAYVLGKTGSALENVGALVKIVNQLASNSGIALQAALVGHYRRAWFVEQAAEAMKLLVDEFDVLAVAGASSKAALDSYVPISAEKDRIGAVLLRARFPGEAGNIAVRFSLNLGQNGLVADGAKNKVSGLTPGDVVWIGAKSNTKGKLYLAYPTQDGSDWYFSTDMSSANAKFWLNQPPNATSTKLQPSLHEVRTVTVAVDVLRQNGSSQTWSGLALQPNHRRAGSADSITAKFSVTPTSGTEARTLPFTILVEEEVDLAGEVYSMLFSRNPADDIQLGAWPISVTHQLTGGNDGTRPGAAEYAGHGEGPDDPKTGLKALEDVEDISIVAAPGAMFGYMNGYKSDAQRIISSLISHAENMKYRIAVLESGDGQSIADVREMRARYDSKYAALYYPWIRVLDPVTRDEIHLPPSGFVAGIYARNDIDRAVYKAPANEVVRGAIGFQTLINKAQQEVLNPEGVNCFRFFEGRGFRLWGARTISSDPEWKYVNVRRYFAYMERSIDRGTQWAVFEPNGEALWANVRETISDFLYNEWKNGALLGSDPKSAYFVRCDRSTMTQNDLDNGRLVCKIGVAALKPAEFVIFQIGQWTGDRKA